MPSITVPDNVAASDWAELDKFNIITHANSKQKNLGVEMNTGGKMQSCFAMDQFLLLLSVPCAGVFKEDSQKFPSAIENQNVKIKGGSHRSKCVVRGLVSGMISRTAEEGT